LPKLIQAMQLSDETRIQLVREYLATYWPQVPAQVAIGDPARVGMPAREAILGVNLIPGISRGYIPASLLQGGIEGALKGQTSRGEAPPAVGIAGRATTSSVGAEASGGDGGGSGGPGD